VNPEKWILAHWIQALVESEVILVLQVAWRFGPDWSSGVEDVVYLHGLPLLLSLVVYTIFYGFGFGAKLDGDG
jgi:hypothetical protein